MALAYVKTLNAANNDVDTTSISNLVVTPTPELWFAYESLDSYFAATSHQRIYSRKYTISSGALTGAVDVSGLDASAKGFGRPGFARIPSTGRLICGYQRDPFASVGQGFVIKESADSGATWGSSYTGGGAYNNHLFRGLFTDDVTGDVVAVTQSAVTAGATITVHKRTGAGTWSAANAFTGGTSNYFNISNYPQQNAILHNGVMIIVGSRATSTAGLTAISSLRCPAVGTGSWTEIPIATYSVAARRQCLLVRGASGIIRLVHSQPGSSSFIPAPAVIGGSGDTGITWSIQGTPQAFNTNDIYGNAVTFPECTSDLMGLAIDPKDTQFLTVPDWASGLVHVFRAFTPGSTLSWQLMQSVTIANGAVVYHPNDGTPIPMASVFASTDLFRVFSISDFTTDPVNPYTQLWLTKLTGAGVLPGGRTGGGGQPKSYKEA